MQIRSFVLAATLLSSSFAARAAVIYSNLANGSTNYGPLGVEGSNYSPYEAVGAEFTAGSGETLTETQVDVAGEPVGDANFDELLYTNNGGVPGTLVATLATDLTAPSAAGIVDVSGLSVALSAGANYWFVLAPYDSNSVVGWEDNGVNLPPTAVTNSGSPSSGWYAVGGVPEQFALLGTPAAATPEPASVALLGTGLLGVAWMVRKRMVRNA